MFALHREFPISRPTGVLVEPSPVKVVFDTSIGLTSHNRIGFRKTRILGIVWLSGVIEILFLDVPSARDIRVPETDIP